MNLIKRVVRWMFTFALLIIGGYFTIAIIIPQITGTAIGFKIYGGYFPQNMPLPASLLEQLPEMPVLGEFVMTTESGVQYEDTLVGEGNEAQRGDLVMIHYTTYLADGTPFDSSLLHNAPLFFSLGSGAIDEGLVGMKVGGERTLVIPPDMAIGGHVPANSTLVYNIQLISIDTTPAPALVSEYITSESGLQVATLQKSEGLEAGNGDRVVVHYHGWLEDGTLFDSSVLNQTPVIFTLGRGKVIAGWDEGIQGMKVGEKRQLRIPANLAHGAPPIAPTLPPKNLIFEIELLEVQPSAILAQAEENQL